MKLGVDVGGVEAGSDEDTRGRWWMELAGARHEGVKGQMDREGILASMELGRHGYLGRRWIWYNSIFEMENRLVTGTC